MQPIRRGRLASIDGTFGVDDLDDVSGQNSLNGSPTSALNVRERGTLPSGMRYAAGEVAERVEERVDTTTISDDGNISRSQEDDVVERYAKWALVPGEFAIVWKDFALKHLRFATPIRSYEDDVRIDLNEFRDNHLDSNPTSFGMAHRGVGDGATKGTLHGINLYNDPDLGDELRDGTLVNELRLEHTWDPSSTRSRYVSVYLARSGYVEVYEPKLETDEFIEYVRDELYPLLDVVDDDASGRSRGEADA